MVQCRENLNLFLDLIHVVLTPDIPEGQNFAGNLPMSSAVDSQMDSGERAASEGVRCH